MGSILRNIVFGILGFLVSIVLQALEGYRTFYFTEQGQLMQSMVRGDISREQFYDRFFLLAETTTLINNFIVLPIMAIIVGCFIGFFVRHRIWLSVSVAILPIIFFPLSDLTMWNLALSIAYIAVAVAAAMIVSRLKNQQNSVLETGADRWP